MGAQRQELQVESAEGWSDAAAWVLLPRLPGGGGSLLVQGGPAAHREEGVGAGGAPED